MLGAITGDIVGSIYEWDNIKTKDFPLFTERNSFTDDSVLTLALADAILNNSDYGQVMREYYRRYPYAGYGGSFLQWARDHSAGPYNSWGNGAAMRTSPVGFALDSLNDVLEKATLFASYTHNHPEGIKGAQATSACAWRITSHAAVKVRSFSRMHRFRVKFRLSAWLSAVSMLNLTALFPSSGLGMRKRW